MSNTCGLCNKEYNKQYLSRCPVCGFNSDKELKKSEVVNNDKLQEIKRDFEWGIKAAGEGQGYTNLDDESVSWLISQLEQAQAEIERLQADNQQLVECLEWYGDFENFQTNVVDQWQPITPIISDLGERARQALASVNKE